MIQEYVCIYDIDENNVAYIKLLIIVEDKYEPSKLNEYLSEKFEKYKIRQSMSLKRPLTARSTEKPSE